MCDVCAVVDSESFVMLVREDGDEMTLCDRCCDVAFPGMRDQMRHECPICSGQDSF